MTSSRSRRLLAVMFTDVVGYTALMQRDEEAARIIRGRHRLVLEEPPLRFNAGSARNPSSGYGSVSIRVTSPTTPKARTATV